MNVLSLFDGMSCGQIALNRAGIKIDNYYASEIDKYSIQVTQANYPNTIQLGDVTKWEKWDIEWDKIDLLSGGSPCQGFSFAGKQLAFDDPRSVLFFEFVKIWQQVKKHNPNAHFLLENVKMKKEHELVISRYMGVSPIEINSSLVSAQNRQRLYWTNIKNESYGFFGDMVCTIPQPKDKGILLKDILESDVKEKYFLSDKMIDYLNMNSEIQKKKGNGFAFTPTDGNKKGKSVTTKAGNRMDDEFIVHNLMPRSSTNGNGGTGHLTRNDGKTYCLDTGRTNAVEVTSRIRRLTPLECERLQTVPDNYTAHVSDTQRYKMLGNGWTVDVITHILSFMK